MSEQLQEVGLGLLAGAGGVFLLLLSLGWLLIVLRGEDEWDELLRENRSLVRITLAVLGLMAFAGAVLKVFA